MSASQKNTAHKFAKGTPVTKDAKKLSGHSECPRKEKKNCCNVVNQELAELMVISSIDIVNIHENGEDSCRKRRERNGEIPHHFEALVRTLVAQDVYEELIKLALEAYAYRVCPKCCEGYAAAVTGIISGLIHSLCSGAYNPILFYIPYGSEDDALEAAEEYVEDAVKTAKFILRAAEQNASCRC